MKCKHIVSNGQKDSTYFEIPIHGDTVINMVLGVGPGRIQIGENEKIVKEHFFYGKKEKG